MVRQSEVCATAAAARSRIQLAYPTTTPVSSSVKSPSTPRARTLCVTRSFGAFRPQRNGRDRGRDGCNQSPIVEACDLSDRERYDANTSQSAVSGELRELPSAGYLFHYGSADVALKEGQGAPEMFLNGIG